MAEIIIKVDDKFLEFAKMDGMEDQYELIRCKDCKFYEDHKRKIYENCTWNNHIIARTPNDFCSRAERKEK